jgi:hypothetical protein
MRRDPTILATILHNLRAKEPNAARDVLIHKAFLAACARSYDAAREDDAAHVADAWRVAELAMQAHWAVKRDGRVVSVLPSEERAERCAERLANLNGRVHTCGTATAGETIAWYART